jgi:hypothetical protein
LRISGGYSKYIEVRGRNIVPERYNSSLFGRSTR